MSKKYSIDLHSGDVTPFDSQVVENSKVEMEILGTQEEVVEEDEGFDDGVDYSKLPAAEDTDSIIDEDDHEAGVPNPLYYLAQNLKDEGILPEDFEISNDISYSDIYTGTKSALEATVSQSVREEVVNALQEQGINEHDISMARALRAGIPPNLLYEAGRYEYFSSIDKEDSSEEQKFEVIEKMWGDKNYSPKEIKRLREAVELEESLDEEFDIAQNYFGKKYTEFVRRSEESQAEQVRMQRELVKRQQEKVQNIVSSRVLLDEKLTNEQAKTLEKSWTDATEIAEVQGKKYKVTPFQKFLLQFNNDIETQLYAFKKYLFKGRDMEEIEQVAKSKWEEEFMKNHNAITTKDLNASRNKQITKKIKEAQTNKKVYTIG